MVCYTISTRDECDEMCGPCFYYKEKKSCLLCLDSPLPAMRMTALSAGSRTSPDADLERLTRWCLAKFHGSVSPGKGEVLSSLGLSSDADLSLRRGRDMA